MPDVHDGHPAPRKLTTKTSKTTRDELYIVLRRGLDVVHRDLAALGYDTSWTCLRASDVGAAHRRDRLFLLAAPTELVGGGSNVADTVRP